MFVQEWCCHCHVIFSLGKFLFNLVPCLLVCIILVVLINGFLFQNPLVAWSNLCCFVHSCGSTALFPSTVDLLLPQLLLVSRPIWWLEQTTHGHLLLSKHLSLEVFHGKFLFWCNCKLDDFFAHPFIMQILEHLVCICGQKHRMMVDGDDECNPQFCSSSFER